LPLEEQRRSTIVRFDEGEMRRATERTMSTMAAASQRAMLSSSRRWEEDDEEEFTAVFPGFQVIPQTFDDNNSPRRTLTVTNTVNGKRNATPLSDNASVDRTTHTGSGSRSNSITTNPLATPTGHRSQRSAEDRGDHQHYVADAIPVASVARQASAATWAQWRRVFPGLLPPVMAKLTHAGRRSVEEWLSETGFQPDAVPSLYTSGSSDAQASLSKRTLASNDRLIRTLNERRRGSSATSEPDLEDSRRRSSTRIRVRPQRGAEDDLVADYNELQDEAENSSDGEDSSRQHVRSEDGLRSSSVVAQ
jgi:hypothetical protein